MDMHHHPERRAPRPWWKKLWANAASVISAVVLIKGGFDVINYAHKVQKERQQEEIAERMDKARKVIHSLFDTWKTGDLEKHMGLWEEDGKQVSDSHARTKAQLREKRTRDFAKYSHVWTKELLIEIPEPNPDKIDVYVNYSMTFVPADMSKPSFSEIDVRERYILVWRKDLNDWRIKLNITYLRGFPSSGNEPVMKKQ